MRLTNAINEWKPFKYFGVIVGCLIASCSINLFVVPNHFLAEGIAGLATIFYYLANMPIGLQTFVYNIPLLIASYKFLGKNYTINVIIGAIIFAICLDATEFLTAYSPVNNVILAAVFGGIFNGLGCGIIFRMNGNTGGFDILGAIIKKYYSLNIGVVIFAFNCIIVTIAGVLFGIEPAMFTLICMYMNSLVTDKVIAGFNRSKTVLIVSEKSEEIADKIINEIKRGVTFLHGKGGFSRSERDILMIIVSLTQIAKLKFIVHAIDRNAFMIIMSASEVVGRGFSKLKT